MNNLAVSGGATVVVDGNMIRPGKGNPAVFVVANGSSHVFARNVISCLPTCDADHNGGGIVYGSDVSTDATSNVTIVNNAIWLATYDTLARPRNRFR